MKKLILISLITGLTLFTSCRLKPEEQVREFAERFTDFVNNNETDSIQKYYPDFDIAYDVVKVPAEELTVVPVDEEEGLYEIEYSPETTILLSLDKNGEITVESSKGLISFPEDKLDLAKKTGMWSSELTDKELAERMNDEDFFEYLRKKTEFNPARILSVNTKLKITETEDNGRTEINYGYYTITNNTSQIIKSSDYKINYTDDYYYDDEGTGIFTKETKRHYSEPGIEINPNEVIKINGKTVFLFGIEELHHLEGVTILLTPEQIQERFVKYNGDEYQEYLSKKGKSSQSTKPYKE